MIIGRTPLREPNLSQNYSLTMFAAWGYFVKIRNQPHGQLIMYCSTCSKKSLMYSDKGKKHENGESQSVEGAKNL